MVKARFFSCFQDLCRVAAWLLLIVITVLSIVPPGYRPVTPAPHDVEHLSPFVAAGLAFGLGYERRHLWQGFALVAFSAAIELIQLAIPGRHARLSDFLVDAVGACLGVGLAALILSAWQRVNRPV
jgi:VanZ family protein